MNERQRLSAGQLATLACLTEVSIPKPGNVHRGVDFEDMTFLDMATAAVAIQPAMDLATGEVGVGKTVLAAVSATQDAVGKNTNLGTVLLFTPLAMAANTLGPGSELARRDPGDLREAVREILASTDTEDVRLVYKAIRLAKPGGLGSVDDADVHSDDPADAPKDLLQAMRLAEDRDLVARQFTSDFETVFVEVVPAIQDRIASGMRAELATIAAHVSLMASYPDSLIARKCGDSIAQESSVRAQKVADLERTDHDGWLRDLSELDFWLRSDAHRRNPGTTADLIAAGIFVLLWAGERFV